MFFWDRFVCSLADHVTERFRSALPRSWWISFDLSGRRAFVPAADSAVIGPNEDGQNE
jgi:hypothetical protein